VKIVFIPAWYPNDYHTWGPYFRDQAEALASLGQDVSILFPVLYSPKWIFQKGKIILGYRTGEERGVQQFFHYLMKNHIATWDRKRNFAVGQKLFLKYVEEKGLPDMVHVQSYWNGDLALWIQKRFGIPYVVTEHFTGFERNLVRGPELALAEDVFRHSSKNLAVSKIFAEKLNKLFSADFQVLPNVVRTEDFPFSPKAKDQGSRFLFIGDFLEKKNPLGLLLGFQLLQKTDPEAQLLLVGKGPLQGKMKKIIQEQKIRKVDFLGYLNRKELYSVIQECDYLVSSSLVETFGVVAIEAMSVGRPILTTRSGGPEELVEKHHCGLIIEGFDPEALAQGMEKIQNMSWDQKALSREAESYSSEKVGQALLSVYEGVLGHG